MSHLYMLYAFLTPLFILLIVIMLSFTFLNIRSQFYFCFNFVSSLYNLCHFWFWFCWFYFYCSRYFLLFYLLANSYWRSQVVNTILPGSGFYCISLTIVWALSYDVVKLLRIQIYAQIKSSQICSLLLQILCILLFSSVLPANSRQLGLPNLQ